MPEASDAPLRMSADPSIRTTGAGWAAAVANALVEHGADRRAVWNDLGWGGDGSAWGRSDRVATESVLRLWQQGERHVGEHFGLLVAHWVTPRTFDLLGASVWYSRSLRDAFSRIAKYSQLIHRTGQLVVCAQPDSCELRFLVKAEERGFVPDIAIDAFVAAVCIIVRQIHSASVSPLRVELERRAPGCTDSFTKLFGCDVLFGAAANSIRFPGFILDEPLPGSHPSVASTFDRMIEERLQELGVMDTRFLVTRKVLEHMRSGDLGLGRIARELGISARNLQFLLAKDGTSYGALLRELRKEVALARLEDDSLSIREVGISVGFAEASSFVRAFRKWFGVPPSVYRRRLLQSGGGSHGACSKECA